MTHNTAGAMSGKQGRTMEMNLRIAASFTAFFLRNAKQTKQTRLVNAHVAGEGDRRGTSCGHFGTKFKNTNFFAAFDRNHITDIDRT